MLSLLADRTFCHLFLAQIVALLGTGLATVALGLMAFDLAGGKAGIVLGTIFAIKMICYIAVAPLAAVVTARLPRRKLLAGLDMIRAAIALLLPFVTEVWQVYILIFLLQSASAAFTPSFQATIPDILPDEERYTRALSLSRLAYDLENLISPMLAAALLMIVSYNGLFIGTSLGFAASAILVASVILPLVSRPPQSPGSVSHSLFANVTRGMRIYLATPRLRGLLALNLSAAAAGAMVLVATVVLVRAAPGTGPGSGLGLGERDVAIALGAFGGGSMLAALLLPRALKRLDSRRIMFAGTVLICATLLVLAAAIELHGFVLTTLLAAWFSIGIGYSAALTPAGRLLRQSSHAEDRPAVFAAQFSLSHVCWLVTYPLAGWLITLSGPATTLWWLAVLAIGGLLTAFLFWRGSDAEELDHDHDDLPPGHPHIRDARSHRHRYVIDDYHRHWPTHR